jgi:two-component system sensor histidine kinase YesM
MKKNRQLNLFKKNLLMFITPLFVSILVFVILSSVITMTYVNKQIYNNNITLLQKAKENMELTFYDLDSLSISLSTNPDIIVTLKSILYNSRLVDPETLNITRAFLDSYLYQLEYIDSIYVYFENTNNQFLTTTYGVSNITHFYDTEWYDVFLEHSNKSDELYTKVRRIKKYTFEKEGLPVLTLFRKIYSLGSTNSNGVVVMNIKLDYLNSIIESSKVFPEQYIAILDKEGNIISETNTNGFKHKPTEIMKSDNLKKDYITTEINSNSYNISFISFVPKGILHNIPNKIIKISVYLFFISLCLGMVLAYYFTKKSYSFVDSLVKIIDIAKKGEAIPTPPSVINDEYNYIIYNLLSTFIEQNYLKLQLSERVYKQKSMELIALQSQINPHFLYNTLETIHMKALGMSGGPNTLSNMVENLSDILRYSLTNPMNTVTFLEEIENTKSYVSIQQARYKEKFYVNWDYSAKIQDYKILKLILQPLIENSIYHGIKAKEGLCGIKIKIKVKEDSIIIAVIDNGIGISTERLLNIRENLRGNTDYSEEIGLLNIDRRLKLTYGEEYGLYIRSKLGLGTVIYAQLSLNW